VPSALQKTNLVHVHVCTCMECVRLNTMIVSNGIKSYAGRRYDSRCEIVQGLGFAGAPRGRPLLTTESAARTEERSAPGPAAGALESRSRMFGRNGRTVDSSRGRAVRVRWWVGMVVMYVCEIRVPVCPRVSRPGSPRCLFTETLYRNMYCTRGRLKMDAC
jgi:hypothetical protein